MRSSDNHQASCPSSRISRAFRRACDDTDGSLDDLLAFYRPLLLQLANSQLSGRIRGKIGASDVVQTALWKASQGFRRQQFASAQDFLAWLRRIVKNEAIDARRHFLVAKKRDINRERELYHPETEQSLQQLAMRDAPSSVERAQRLEQIEQVLAAFETLPAHYRLILRLRYFEQRSFESIAAVLQRTPESTRLLHRRALTSLRYAALQR